MKKQFMAKLLVLAMVLAMVPITILAASAANDPTTTAGSTNALRPITNVNGNYGYSMTSVNNYYYYDIVTDTAVTTTRVDEADIDFDDDGETATIEINVVSGVASATLSDKALASLAEKGAKVLKLSAEGATQINLTASGKALATFAEKTGESLTIESDLCSVTFSNEALIGFKTLGSIKMTFGANNATGFAISAGGKALSDVKGIQVNF